MRVHDTSARWVGRTNEVTTPAGGHKFIVEGFPARGQNQDFPDQPGTPNTYSKDPVDPNTDFITALDVCVPQLPGSAPQPYVP